MPKPQVEQETFSAMDLTWSDLHATPIRPCNLFVVHAQRSGHVLNCGVASQTVKPAGSQVRAKDIQVQVVARILLTEKDITDLIEVLQKNVATRRQLVSQA